MPPATTAGTCQFDVSWRDSRSAVVSVAPPRDSSSAAAIEVISAGICVTSPSPMVRREYVSNASEIGMECTSTPAASPTKRLISVMISPAMASPLTNFDAPSSEPKKLISRCS